MCLCMYIYIYIYIYTNIPCCRLHEFLEQLDQRINGK